MKFLVSLVRGWFRWFRLQMIKYEREDRQKTEEEWLIDRVP